MEFKRVKISACRAKPHYVLWLRFSDGLEGEVDLSDLVGKGVFKAWKVKKFFDAVRVDSESGTVCWDREIDLDPYVLYNDVLSAQKPRKKTSKARKSKKPAVTKRSRSKIR
ncbi:MAG TPA: DUF2442 domain-containing protein [Chlamydiales bacterium]|nr:DUF2442 domain-containing protein [Chlamydiales bacterium]